MTTETNPQLLLWGAGTSRTMRPHWALTELGLPYTCNAVGSRSAPTTSEEFTKLHPGQKIPLLQDGDVTIFDSTAIILYLADRYGDGNLLPSAGTPERGLVYQWCFHTMTELDAHTLYVNFKHGGRLSKIYGESPVAVKTAVAGFAKQIQVAGTTLADGRPFLLGEQFTIADIVLGTCLMFAQKQHNVDELMIPESVWAYKAKLEERPGYQTALMKNTPS